VGRAVPDRLGLGPVRGIFANIAIYLPLTLFLFRTKFTGHLRDHGPRPPAAAGGLSANGLRAGSGFTVGILGAAIGIHASLGFSAAALCLGTLAAGTYALRDR
jgi:hypothetical protein